MSDTQTTRGVATIHVENIGGIDETEVTFTPGVTVLAGRNATNRTSLLHAIRAVMGSEDVPLKADADEGRVSLSVEGETYTRTLRREGGAVVAEGEPLLEAPETAELFAFLLELNEARQAVARGEDLREVIMAPVDTEAISAEIDALEAERREVTDRIDELDDIEAKLPALAEERDALTERLAAKRDALSEKRDEIEALDRDVEESRDEREALDERLEELGSARSELEELRRRIDAETESRERLAEERDELTAELTELPELPAGEIAELESQADRLRERRQTVESDLNELQSIIGFNEEMLEGSGPAALEPEPASDQDGSVTDQLLDDDSQVACWTCGTTVAREQIERTVDRLGELRAQKVSRSRELREELEECRERVRELESDRDRREELERRIERTEEELDERADRLATLRDRREELEARVTTLESEVADLEAEEFDEVIQRHTEANQLSFEIDSLEEDLTELDEREAELEAELEERESLETRREEIQSALTELRTRIERLEREAIERFNEGMETVLDLLGYDNLERVWLERTEQTVREGRRTVTRGAFELHVVRTTEDGAAYEDTVEHLSESEREVTGLLFALAGYLVHDLSETCPFMLLDSLEAIDSERIATLVDYLDGRADHLVVALLPEDAAALDGDYERVEAI